MVCRVCGAKEDVCGLPGVEPDPCCRMCQVEYARINGAVFGGGDLEFDDDSGWWDKHGYFVLFILNFLIPALCILLFSMVIS